MSFPWAWRSVLDPWLIAQLRTMGGLLLGLAVGSVPLLAQSPSPEPVFRDYMEALAHADHEKVVSYWASDLVFVHEGTRTPPNRDAMKGYREFEKATHARWRYKIESTTRDAVDVILTEDNEFYDALGLGERTSRIIYRFRNSLMSEIETKYSSHGGRPYPPVLREFVSWLKQRPTDSSRVMKRDSLVFDSSTATLLVYLARSWRESVPGRTPG